MFDKLFVLQFVIWVLNDEIWLWCLYFVFIVPSHTFMIHTNTPCMSLLELCDQNHILYPFHKVVLRPYAVIFHRVVLQTYTLCAPYTFHKMSGVTHICILIVSPTKFHRDVFHTHSLYTLHVLQRDVSRLCTLYHLQVLQADVTLLYFKRIPWI